MRQDIDKIAVAAGDRFFGAQTVYGYQTQVWLGRLRFHIFHREDPGEALHDHPWDFWTFPLTSYVEQVLDDPTDIIDRRIVPAFRWSFRKASHTHRIIGRANGRGVIVTLVWRGRGGRPWHYVNVKNGKVHRLPWRRYLELADRQ